MTADYIMTSCRASRQWVSVSFILNAVLMMRSFSLAMFTSRTRQQLGISVKQAITDIAVADVDGDGYMEMILVSSNGPNVVLSYDFTSQTYIDLILTKPSLASLRDEYGITNSVCVCDIDGNGKEEIYLLNNNKRNLNHKVYKDRLLRWQNEFNRFDDVFNDDINSKLSATYNGHLVNCLDRNGNGKYGILISDIGDTEGSLALLETEVLHDKNRNRTERIVLYDVTNIANLSHTENSRSLSVGPILGKNGRSDIFLAGYRGGSNQLLKNNNFVSFYNIAPQTGINGTKENGVAAALADLNYDGLVDIVIANMMGSHRLYMQHDAGSDVLFLNKAIKQFEEMSLAKSVIVADFDNDGVLEMLLVNEFYQSPFDTGVSLTTENSLYRVESSEDDILLINISAGDARLSGGHITRATVADMDRDGLLELYIFNEDANKQSLSVYHVSQGKQNNWLRIMPMTQNGAPARGAIVKLLLTDNRLLLRIVDPGSDSEPVTHFGLGQRHPVEMTLLWPDGHSIRKSVLSSDINVTLKVGYFGRVSKIFSKNVTLPSSKTNTTFVADDMHKASVSSLVLVAIVFISKCLVSSTV